MIFRLAWLHRTNMHDRVLHPSNPDTDRPLLKKRYKDRGIGSTAQHLIQHRHCGYGTLLIYMFYSIVTQNICNLTAFHALVRVSGRSFEAGLCRPILPAQCLH